MRSSLPRSSVLYNSKSDTASVSAPFTGRRGAPLSRRLQWTWPSCVTACASTAHAVYLMWKTLVCSTNFCRSEPTYCSTRTQRLCAVRRKWARRIVSPHLCVRTPTGLLKYHSKSLGSQKIHNYFAPESHCVHISTIRSRGRTLLRSKSGLTTFSCRL